jgi:hypothetical protein
MIGSITRKSECITAVMVLPAASLRRQTPPRAQARQADAGVCVPARVQHSYSPDVKLVKAAIRYAVGSLFRRTNTL